MVRFGEPTVGGLGGGDDGGVYIGIIRVPSRGREDEKGAVSRGELKFCGVPMMVLNSPIEFRNSYLMHFYDFRLTWQPGGV